MKEMQWMNILFNHQFCVGNQVADILARMGKSGQNELFDNFKDLLLHIKGLLRTKKLGLHYIIGHLFFCFL